MRDELSYHLIPLGSSQGYGSSRKFRLRRPQPPPTLMAPAPTISAQFSWRHILKKEGAPPALSPLFSRPRIRLVFFHVFFHSSCPLVDDTYDSLIVMFCSTGNSVFSNSLHWLFVLFQSPVTPLAFIFWSFFSEDPFKWHSDGDVNDSGFAIGALVVMFSAILIYDVG